MGIVNALNSGPSGTLEGEGCTIQPPTDLQWPGRVGFGGLFVTQHDLSYPD